MPVPAPRPLLLLDIGGVICVRNAHGMDGTVDIGGATRSLAADIEAKLHEVSAYFQLAWASAWGAEANSQLGPPLHLPPLDHVNLETEGDFGQYYKLAGVQAFSAGRATAWVDDDLGAGCREWAESREQPALLLETDPELGLTWAHVDDLALFARQVEDACQIQGP